MQHFVVTIPFTFTYLLPRDWPVTVAATTNFHRLEDQIRRNFDDVTVDSRSGILCTALEFAPYVYGWLSSNSFAPETPALANDPTVSRDAFTALYRDARARADQITPEGCSLIGVRVSASATLTADLERSDATADVKWDGSLEVTWAQSPGA